MLLLFDVRASLRTLLLWGLALLVVMTLYCSFYPSMGMDAGMEQFIQTMPKGMVDALGFAAITSGAGWVHSTFFALLGLFVLCGAGVVWGRGAIAGQEEAGVLELTLAHGISRTSVYWQKVTAIAVRFAFLGLVVALGLAVLNGPAKLGLDWANVPAEILSYLLIGFLCSCVALAIGAGTGKSGSAVGGGAAVIVLSFIFDALGKANQDLEYLRNFSALSWAYHEIPLLHGLNASLWLVALVAVVVLCLGWIGFLRRDVA